MERYKPIFQLIENKQWITCKLSEIINHVQEIQAITFIYNHLKQQNQNALKNKKEADTKIVIQRILGLLRDGKTINQIVAITRESLFFVQLIKTIYDKEYFGENNKNSLIEYGPKKYEWKEIPMLKKFDVQYGVHDIKQKDNASLQFVLKLLNNEYQYGLPVLIIKDKYYYFKIENNKLYIDIHNKLNENLRLTDLTKNAGLSDFSKKFAKQTNKLMGTPTQHTKLVQARINKAKDYVTFVWKTLPTPKDKKVKNKAVNPKTMELVNSSRYTIEIRILDFFKLLQERANKSDITDKDIEDVLFKADIKIFDSTPSFQYQGSNYILTTFDAAIYPETRPPKHWSQYHDYGNFLSKHSAGVITSIKFFLPIMRQMIKSYLFGKK